MRIQEIDYNVDLLQAILWQYNDATRLLSLLTQKKAWYDLNQSAYWQDWYDDVFNLQTANAFGLSVWAIILNVPLFLDINPEDPAKPIFGFNEVTVFPAYINSYLNFENSNYSSRGDVIILSEEEQRLILRLRYFQLVTRGAIPEINTFLAWLFAPNGVWALDNFDMTMTYIFDYTPSQALREALQRLDALPRPAAVGLHYIVLTGTVWGFGTLNQNFENGNFIPESF